MKKSIVVVLAIVVAVLFQTSLLSVSWLAAAADPTILRVGTLQGIQNLSPFTAYEDSEYVVFNLVYDRLMTYDEDLEIVPLIATSWEVDRWADADDPGTTEDEGADKLWRYEIVTNATWHDGEPLDAEDVAYSININLNEVMWAFTPYINWRMADHAAAIDADTVEVYLDIPNVHVDALSIPIVPEHIWTQWTPDQIQYGQYDEELIGSGPFKFVEIVPDQRVVLERNDDYFMGPVAYDEVVFYLYGNDQVMREDLVKGNIDVARFPPNTYESLVGEAGIGTAEVKKYYQSTLGFNSFTDLASKGNRMLLDENVRRAMHMAINKTYIIDTVFLGYADMGYALPAPVTPYFHWQPTAAEELAYNVTRANDLLNASGYDKWNSDGIRMVNTTGNPNGAEGTLLSFNFSIRNEAPEDIAAAPYIVEFWEQIGVKATIQLMEESAMETLIYYTAGHDAYMWYWSGDYDPTYILGVMTEDQFWGWNDPFWTNDTYDELYIEQMTQTGAERQATVFEMQKIWYESSGMICMSYPYGLYGWNTEFFENWGDPAAHPGRTIDHYFGAPPLYMELEPTGATGGGGISNTVLIGIGVVIAVVVVAVVAFMMMKRKPKAGEPGKESEAEKKTGLE